MSIRCLLRPVYVHAVAYLCLCKVYVYMYNLSVIVLRQYCLQTWPVYCQLLSRPSPSVSAGVSIQKFVCVYAVACLCSCKIYVCCLYQCDGLSMSSQRLCIQLWPVYYGVSIRCGVYWMVINTLKVLVRLYLATFPSFATLGDCFCGAPFFGNFVVMRITAVCQACGVTYSGRDALLKLKDHRDTVCRVLQEDPEAVSASPTPSSSDAAAELEANENIGRDVSEDGWAMPPKGTVESIVRRVVSSVINARSLPSLEILRAEFPECPEELLNEIYRGFLPLETDQ